MVPRARWLAASAVAALAVYALLWTGYALQWNWVTTVDSAGIESLRASPGWVHAWDIACTVAGPAAFRVFTVVLIIVALARRNFRVAIFLLVTVELAGLVTQIAKIVADRPRPGTALVAAPGLSFPSGHALGVLVAVLALATVALPVVRPALRGWLVALGAVVVAVTGVGRVVLNVHHPSDVLAGWALGYAYFVFCLLTVSPSRRVTAAERTPEAPDSAR